MSSYEDGQPVFFLHEEHSWIVGNISGAKGKKGWSVKFKDPVTDKGEFAANDLPDESVYPVSNPNILTEDANDLMHLTELHQCTLLHAVRRRYLEDVVYTYIGPIVIALNPFNYNIPWYKDDFMPNYLVEGPVIQKNKPHSWSVAHNTYYEMINDQMNQCVLVSGESGAGKTEAVKIVLKYIRGLMSVRAKDETQRAALCAINDRILLSSPILESFGNAKTGRNDNSSRFGKFMQVQFDSTGSVAGSYAIPYLLEKSRVVVAAKGERVYHAFYQVAKGKDKAKYMLGNDPKLLPSLMSGGSLDNASMEDAEGDDLSYRMTNEAYGVCGIDGPAGDAVWRNVAAILLLLRTEFIENGPEACSVDPKSEADLSAAATLWRLDPAKLKEELLQTVSELRGETITMLHTVKQAASLRQSLSMQVYNGLFLWLFDTINATTTATAHDLWIGLLDIFGFEDFAVNSFEQLCINLANETLQNHYNDYIFTKDMEECKSEGVDVTSIEFADNTITCRLLTDKLGIFALLDEECALGKGSDMGFLEKITNQHGKHVSFKKETLWKTCFAVKHYAGTVKYEIANFLDKNRDRLKDSLKLLFRSSECPVTKIILPEPVDKRGRAPTVSGIFVSQIGDLMTLINSTNPHWIRCVKPHPAKKPKMFHGSSSMAQMVSSGIIETVRIRCLGFPVRIPHAQFMSRFAVFARNASLPCSPSDPTTSCRNILQALALPPELAQIGKTKVFMKSHTYISTEERKRAALHGFATMVQRHARTHAVKGRIDELMRAKFKPFFMMRDMQRDEGTQRAENTEKWLKEHSEGLDKILESKFQEWDALVGALERAARAAALAKVVNELVNEEAAVRSILHSEAAAAREADMEALKADERAAWATLTAELDRRRRLEEATRGLRSAQVDEASRRAALRKKEAVKWASYLAERDVWFQRMAAAMERREKKKAAVLARFVTAAGDRGAQVAGAAVGARVARAAAAADVEAFAEAEARRLLDAAKAAAVAGPPPRPAGDAGGAASVSGKGAAGGARSAAGAAAAAAAAKTPSLSLLRGVGMATLQDEALGRAVAGPSRGSGPREVALTRAAALRAARVFKQRVEEEKARDAAAAEVACFDALTPPRVAASVSAATVAMAASVDAAPSPSRRGAGTFASTFGGSAAVNSAVSQAAAAAAALPGAHCALVDASDATKTAAAALVAELSRSREYSGGIGGGRSRGPGAPPPQSPGSPHSPRAAGGSGGDAPGSPLAAASGDAASPSAAAAAALAAPAGTLTQRELNELQLHAAVSAAAELVDPNSHFARTAPANLRWQRLLEILSLERAVGRAGRTCILQPTELPLDARGPAGETALHWACAVGAASLVRLLSTWGMSADDRDSEGNTPLHYAVANGRVQTVKMLLAWENIDTSLQNHLGLTALDYGLAYGVHTHAGDVPFSTEAIDAALRAHAAMHDADARRKAAVAAKRDKERYARFVQRSAAGTMAAASVTSCGDPRSPLNGGPGKSEVSDACGWLWRMVGATGVWQRRLFYLYQGMISYHHAGAYVPTLDLADVAAIEFGSSVVTRRNVRPPVNSYHAVNAFELRLTCGTRHLFVADSPKLRDAWVRDVKTMAVALKKGVPLPGHGAESDVEVSVPQQVMGTPRVRTPFGL